jgi:nitroreductase
MDTLEIIYQRRSVKGFDPNQKISPEEEQKLLEAWMSPFHEGREWLQRDEAQCSIGMAMQTL